MQAGNNEHSIISQCSSHTSSSKCSTAAHSAASQILHNSECTLYKQACASGILMWGIRHETAPVLSDGSCKASRGSVQTTHYISPRINPGSYPPTNLDSPTECHLVTTILVKAHSVSNLICIGTRALEPFTPCCNEHTALERVVTQ